MVTPSGGIVRLKIVGFFQSGLADIDKLQSYTNIKTAQKVAGETSNYVTDISVKLFDIEQAKPMTDEIVHNNKINAVDIKTANAQFETGTSIRNLITYAVSITLLIVAGFGIYNILNMSNLPPELFSDIMKFLELRDIILQIMVLNKKVRQELKSQNYILFKKFI